MMAKDLEKKAFYRANAKEMGYTALKTGIAKLNRPYDNDYLNENFNLSMITPTEGREDVYKAYMSKMILDSIGDDITYRDLGITSISPDFESTSRIMNVCKNYHIKYNLIPVIEFGYKCLFVDMFVNNYRYDTLNKVTELF